MDSLPNFLSTSGRHRAHFSLKGSLTQPYPPNKMTTVAMQLMYNIITQTIKPFSRNWHPV